MHEKQSFVFYIREYSLAEWQQNYAVIIAVFCQTVYHILFKLADWTTQFFLTLFKTIYVFSDQKHKLIVLKFNSSGVRRANVQYKLWRDIYGLHHTDRSRKHFMCSRKKNYTEFCVTQGDVRRKIAFYDQIQSFSCRHPAPILI